MTVKAIRIAALVSAFDLIQGDIRLVRMNGVFIVRMIVSPGFDPRLFDGVLLRICPEGDATRPMAGSLRYHALPNDRRCADRSQLVIAGQGNSWTGIRRLPLSPIVRAVCAKTVGYRFVADAPLPSETPADGEVVFRLPGGQERRHRYVSVPPVTP